MGVRGLESFVREEIPGGYEKIDIIPEIVYYKQQHGIKNPIIVFDMMGVIHSLGGSFTELLCGGRHNVYLDKIEGLFKRLVKHDAKLVFFCDGQLQLTRVDEWSRRRNAEYKEFMCALDQIDRGTDVFQLNGRRHRVCKNVVGSILCIARNYGEVIISTDCDCDAALAQYAVRNKALAVVANDSDYLIFEGDWQHWHAESLNFDKLQVMRYGRQELSDFLCLTRREMHLFATLVGNDYMKPGPYRVDFGHPKRLRFRRMADYVISLNIFRFDELSETFFERTCIDLFGRTNRLDNAIAMMRMSIKSYDIEFDMPTTKDRLLDYAAENVLMSAILYDGIFQYDLNFIDFRSENNNNAEKSFTDAILPVFSRLAGILLQHLWVQDKVPVLKICIKPSSKDDYALQCIAPIYPKQTLSPLIKFLFRETEKGMTTKWNMVTWALSLTKAASSKIRNVPHEYLITVLALTFMVQEHLITVAEADAIFVTEHDIITKHYHPDNVKAPRVLDGRAVRVAHLYNKVIMLISDSLYICGLNKCITNFTFDGYYFHWLLAGLQKVPLQYMAVRKIDKFRLYDI